MFSIELNGIVFTAATVEEVIEMARTFQSSPVLDGHTNSTTKNATQDSGSNNLSRKVTDLARRADRARQAGCDALGAIARVSLQGANVATEVVKHKAGAVTESFEVSLSRMSKKALVKALRHVPHETLYELMTELDRTKCQKGETDDVAVKAAE